MSKQKRDNSDSSLQKWEGVCYLDNAGAARASNQLLEDHFNYLKSRVMYNPHSMVDGESPQLDYIEAARNQVLSFFNASKDYMVIFTSSATQAIRMVGEYFDYSPSGVLYYMSDNHTSVLGMREYAFANGAQVCCASNGALKAPIEGSEFLLHRGLFVYPAQSNFSGTKYDITTMVKEVKKGSTSFPFSRQCSEWCVMVDAASFVSTSPLHLDDSEIDFVPVSFYKIFGYPTGLGALLVRKQSIDKLKKIYFGGGTVEGAGSYERFHYPRTDGSAWFEDGTLPFQQISALKFGFQQIENLGGMAVISTLTFQLAKMAYDTLLSLQHYNGTRLVELYCDTEFDDVKLQGPIIAFNLKRSDGKYIGYNEVQRLAQLYQLVLRYGCFCNIGACQEFLEISNDQLRQNHELGHKCGDAMDIVNGRPTGAIRASFGYDSTVSDVQYMLSFLEESFCELDDPNAQSPEPSEITNGEAGKYEGEVTLSAEIEDVVEAFINTVGEQGSKSSVWGAIGGQIPTLKELPEVKNENNNNILTIEVGNSTAGTQELASEGANNNNNNLDVLLANNDVFEQLQLETDKEFDELEQEAHTEFENEAERQRRALNNWRVSHGFGLQSYRPPSRNPHIRTMSSSDDDDDIDIVNELSYRNTGEMRVQSEILLIGIYLYPIKSCSFFKVKSWPVSKSGLLYDRMWSIVSSENICLSLKRCVDMRKIQPAIDLEEGLLILRAEGFTDVSLPLENPNKDENIVKYRVCSVKICGKMVDTVDCGKAASDWISDVLAMPGCRLVRRRETTPTEDSTSAVEGPSDETVAGDNPSNQSLANDSQYTLISKNSVNSLCKYICEKMNCYIEEDEMVTRFRGNFVISGSPADAENDWSSLEIGSLHVKSEGECERCSMISVDNGSGAKMKEPLRSLGLRKGAKASFGIHLSTVNFQPGHVKEGDTVKAFVKV